MPAKSRRPPLGQIITFDRAALSISLSSSDLFFIFYGGVGGGDLVVFVLCGGGFCVDSGGFFVGAGVWVLVNFLWVLMSWWWWIL